MKQDRVRVWDLPTRLFHWLLVALIVAAIVSGKIGGNAMIWHGRIGVAILGLLAFRLVWGFIGSTYARFASFFPTPASVVAYLRGQWHGLGHNPLGAFSVFAMLALIAVQVGTGLFANDGIAFRGPLYNLVNVKLSRQLTEIHTLAINVLVALIALHLCAIAFYAHIKKDKLVGPMITGWKEVEDAKARQGEAARGGGALAFVVALLIAVAAVYAGSGAWMPAPPPAAATPTW